MDENEFELLQRRLTDEVRETVRGQLFRTYSIAGVAVIAVLGYANWNLFDDMKTEIRARADTAVQEAVEDAQAKIEDLKEDVAEQYGRIEAERQRANQVRDQVTNQLRQLDLETHNLTTLNENVATLADARRQLEIEIADMKARTESLSVIASELKRLTARIQEIDSSTSGGYETTIQTLEAAEQKSKELLARPTVYLQFAGGARSRAQELAQILTEDGFVMPGEERHAGAAGKREIRYYYAEDVKGAEALAKATLAALRHMGYPTSPEVDIKDLTGYSGTKPKPGILELWVEL